MSSQAGYVRLVDGVMDLELSEGNNAKGGEAEDSRMHATEFFPTR